MRVRAPQCGDAVEQVGDQPEGGVVEGEAGAQPVDAATSAICAGVNHRPPCGVVFGVDEAECDEAADEFWVGAAQRGRRCPGRGVAGRATVSAWSSAFPGVVGGGGGELLE